MSTTILVPPELQDRLSAFLAADGPDCELATSEPADIRILPGDRQSECTTDTLYTGGRLACATAWAMAAKHGIAMARVGALADALDIRIRQCTLGCFP